MDETLTKLADILPPKWRATAGILLVLSPFLTRAFYALKNQGGIKGVLSAIWLGTNTPKPQDTTKQ